MYKYIIKRLLMMIPVIIGVTIIIFLIMALSPGDPARLVLGEMASEESVANWREAHGLNDPLPIRYVNYMKNMLKGDLGTSYANGRSVATEISSRFPITLRLAIVGMIVALVIAIPLGIVSAVKQYSLIDGFATIFGMLGIALPSFWVALMMILLFSLKLNWLPSGGIEGWQSMVMPAISIGFGCCANIMRITRSSMLEVIRTDYIRTAKSKGVKKKDIIGKHALRNVLIPVITVAGLQFGAMMGGAVIAETVFSWPGVGTYMISSIKAKDTPAVMGSIICFCIAFSLVNLLVDLVYGYIDPRIKSSYK
nr:ABC transporter permease [uncultured Criibacterium sp.]